MENQSPKAFIQALMKGISYLSITWFLMRVLFICKDTLFPNTKQVFRHFSFPFSQFHLKQRHRLEQEHWGDWRAAIREIRIGKRRDWLYRKNDKANGIKADESPERQRFGTFLWLSEVSPVLRHPYPDCCDCLCCIKHLINTHPYLVDDNEPLQFLIYLLQW